MDLDIEIDPLSTEIPIDVEQEKIIENSIVIKVEPLSVCQEVKSEDIKTATENNNENSIEESNIISPVTKLKKKKSKDKLEKNSKKVKKKIVPKKKLIPKDYKASQEVEELTSTIPFYACSVCDIKFNKLDDLQNHVATHKDRLTSWGLRVKNLTIRKKLKKEKKKLKKIKKENDDQEVTIKQELPDYDDNQTTLPNQIEQVSNGAFLHQNNHSNIINSENTNDKNKQNDIKQDASSNNDNDLEKIFKCGGCGKKFTLGYYLRLHVRSHTGEKPYKCEECPQTFITASKLGRHRKRAHLSVRFECRICRRPYTRLEFLTRHFNKYHADDKIDGEPYDYYAILPYLKVLEEEMQKKKEEEERQKKEEKIKEIDFQLPIEMVEELKPKTENETWPTEVKSELEEKVTVKDESCQEEAYAQQCVAVASVFEPVDTSGLNDQEADVPLPSPGFNDDQSDEDYFPDETWVPAASPDIDVKPLSPLPKKRKTKKGPKAKNKCKICHKEVSSYSYLKIHMRTHTGLKPFECHLCTKAFITDSKLNRHLLTHEEWDEADQKPLKPDLDSESARIKEESDVTNNVDENDPEKPKRRKRRKCPIPDKLPTSEKGRKKKRPHACEFCNKKFLYLEALQVHKRNHVGESIVFSCNYCQVVFESDEALKDHEKEHTGPRPYVCTVCGRNYKKKESMVYHKKMHSSERKYQCEVCPKTFNAQCKLQRHLLSHRPDKFVVRYECPVCAHIFNTKYHIEMHLTTHEKEGVIQQENRGQVLAMVMQNARKIPLEQDSVPAPNSLPNDERSRICNICGELFEHFYYLEQHLKTHGSTISIKTQSETEEKRYICKICNKGFKLSYYLKLHSFTHTKEKPYTCQQCGKGFITKGKLKRHLETHTGLKKYQCHVCCKYFTRPSYLRIHVRTIHGTQDYNLKVNNDFGVTLPLGNMPVYTHKATREDNTFNTTI